MAYGTGDAEDRQIKRLYAVMHSLGIDPKQWKKDHNIASYAKMTWEERSKYITELEEQEKEKKGEVPAGGATIKDDVEKGEAKKSVQPTVPELIAKYTDILAQVTEAVNAEDRIPEHEKGYATKFIFYSVRGALENGGDHEEGA
jgi:hypothetical protein